MKALKVHLKGFNGQTMCGLGGFSPQIADEPEQVTCKRCLRTDEERREIANRQARTNREKAFERMRNGLSPRFGLAGQQGMAKKSGSISPFFRCRGCGIKVRGQRLCSECQKIVDGPERSEEGRER